MKYEIKYSSRKTISIKITRDAEVVVLAPYETERSKIEDLICKHEDWILSHLEKMEKRVQATPNFTNDEIIELKREAKVCLSSMVERFSKFMDLKYGRITITSAKSRFGSCSSEGNLSFSYRCILYPVEVQEYIVVHELLHIKIRLHNEEFTKLLSHYFPNWRNIKDELNEFVV